MSAKKKYLTITFIHLIQKAHHILSLPISSFIFLTLTPNIPILLTAIPQHIVINPIHCTGYTAFLKTFHSHVWWDALPCPYDPHWLNFTFSFLVLRIYLKPWRFTIFSTDGASGVKKLNICVLDFLLSLWSDQFEFMAHILVFNLWIGTGFIFESCSWF